MNDALILANVSMSIDAETSIKIEQKVWLKLISNNWNFQLKIECKIFIDIQ